MVTLSVKAVIDSNRSLLVRNIIPCQEFYDNISRLNVFPDTMLKDIKARAKPVDKNERLLELLVVRGPAALNGFCDALQLSGHNFLAELLRDEVRGGTPEAIQWEDLARIVPSLDKTVNRQQREDVTKVVNAKIRDEVQRELLRRAALDKEKVIESKQRQLEDSWRFTELLREKDSLIETLEGGLEQAVTDARSHGVNVHDLKNIVEQTKQKHKKDLETQMNYNTANEKSLQRLTERQCETEATLDYVTDQLTLSLRVEETQPELQRGETLSPNLTLTSVDRAKETLKKTLQRLSELESTHRAHDLLVEERQYLAGQIGADANADLREALQQYVVTQDETLTSLRAEVTSLKDEVAALKEAATENATAKTEHVNMLESSVSDLKNRIESKNAMVTELRADISSKEARLAALLAENKTLQKKLASVDKSIALSQSHGFHNFPADDNHASHHLHALRASPESAAMQNGIGSLSHRDSPDAVGRLSPSKAQATILSKPVPRISPQNSLSLHISALPPVSPRQKRKELRQQRKQQEQQLQQQRVPLDVLTNGPDQSAVSVAKTGGSYDSTYVSLQRLKGSNADNKRNFSSAGWNHWPGAAPRSDYLRK